MLDLRLQLLEPEKFPHLYKCLYGLLMLLPQSSAFAALKNRLNSVSAIGYLHIAPRTYVFSPSATPLTRSRNNSVVDGISNFQFPQRQKTTADSTHAPQFSAPATAPPSNYDRPNRLKGRDEGIRWNELLEKFRSTQEKARRSNRVGNEYDDGYGWAGARNTDGDTKAFKDLVRLPGPSLQTKDVPATPAAQVQAQKAKTGLGAKFGRLGGGGTSSSKPKR